MTYYYVKFRHTHILRFTSPPTEGAIFEYTGGYSDEDILLRSWEGSATPYDPVYHKSDTTCALELTLLYPRSW